MKLIHKEVKILVVDHVRTGSDFRQWREGLQISIRELAAESGFTAPYISDLERGRRNWKQENMNWLEKAAKEILYRRENKK